VSDTNIIIAKIKKILALSKNNDSIEEAASALARAQALMTKYRIDQAMVDALDDNIIAKENIIEAVVYGVEGDDGSSKIHSWKTDLAEAIADVNGCTTFYTSGTNIKVIGRETDVLVVSYLFSYVMDQIERMCKAASKLRRETIMGWNRSRGRKYANNFKLGAVNTVSERLRAGIKALRTEQYMLAQASTDVTALARLDTALATLDARQQQATDEMKRLHPKLRTVTHKYRPDPSGWKDGCKAGKDIDLDSSAKGRRLSTND